MIHAYSEDLLEYAMDNLGTAIDYAVNYLGFNGQEFITFFVMSGVAKEFANGNPRYVTGMSGRSMSEEVYRLCGKQFPQNNKDYNGDYTPEYWCGWILAYYQWHSSISFDKIAKALTYDQILNVYSVLHEADPSKAVEVFDKVVRAESFLARARKKRKMTQAELAQKSGVSLRSIQLYEQRKNDINKAQYNHLQSIASVLHCSIEEIIE